MTLHVELNHLRITSDVCFFVVFLWPEDVLQYAEQVLEFKLWYKICKWNFSTGKKEKLYSSDSDFYRELIFFKIASNIFEWNFVPPANHCVVERRAIFKHMLHVTTDLYVFVQFCLGKSSVKKFTLLK